MTQTRRETLLSIAFAAWGLAVAIALASIWMRPAPAGQLPGLATRFGFDAHGPFRWIAGLMLLPIVFAVVLRPLARRIGDGFAFRSAFVAPLVALWFVSVNRDVWWVLIPVAIVIACSLVRTSDLERTDAILILTFLATLLAVIDIVPDLAIEKCVVVAALIVFVLRVFLPPHAFAVAPLAMLLQTGFLARDQRHFGWVPLAIVVISPIVLRFLPRIDRRVVMFAVYPLALWAYANATSIQTAEGRARVSMFEDSHSLLPASQYLRGELPYRDVLPLHGLIEDGLIDYTAMKIGGTENGVRLKARTIAGGCVALALYALAFGVTGSAEAAVFAVLLAFMTGTYTSNLRLLPPLITLALIAAAVRWRRPRLFAYAGVGTVLCGLTSIDFGFYTFVAFVFALVRQRGQGWRYGAIGVAAGVVPMSVVFAALGILDDFVRALFAETLSLGPVYVLDFFTPPVTIERTPSFPDLLVSLLHRDTFLIVFWCAMTILVAVMVMRRPRRRVEPLLILGVWVVLTALAYAERHHLYFDIVVTTALVHAIRRMRRDVAAIAIVASIVLAAPTTHLIIVSMVRHARGPLESNWVTADDVPRARGALYLADDAAVIHGAVKYASARLAPDETFLDFTNRGILYFLLDRDCPIREYEVANYETVARQQEIIRRIESNPKVVAVLLPGPSGRYMVDGVPNADRAPLVWNYIRTHFHPDFEEGDTLFWRRN